MMKKGRKIRVSSRKVLLTDSVKPHSSTAHILHDAWENLPYDFSDDERLMFLEIAEMMIRVDKTQDYEDERNVN